MILQLRLRANASATRRVVYYILYLLLYIIIIVVSNDVRRVNLYCRGIFTLNE